MQTDHLQAVLTIAELGSMRRAAGVLHCSQSSLSQMLGRVEKELGIRLFERQPTGLSVRPAAEAVIAEMRATLDQIDRLKDSAAAAARGREGRLVVMSASPSNQYILPDAIATWRQMHPGIELVFRSGHQPEQMQALSEGSCDVGLLGMPDPHPGVVFHEIATVHLLLAVPAAGPLREASFPNLQDADLPMAMVPESVCPGIARCVGNALRAAGITPSETIAVQDLASLLGYVGAGSAWGLIPQGFTGLLPDRISFSPLPEGLRAAGSFGFCLAQREDDRREVVADWLHVLRGAAQRIYDPSGIEQPS